MLSLFMLVNASRAQRVVLLEQFTNSGCSICATHDPATYSYVANNPTQVIAISYHTSFPYFDSMYLENPVESNAITSFYNVVGVPYSIIDGNYYRNSTSNFNTVIASTISNRAAITPGYALTALQNDFSGNTLTSRFAFQSLTLSNATDSLRAFIVVIEKDVLKSSYASSPGSNSQMVYNYVMRKMLSDASSSYLLNRNLNGIDTLSFTWNMQHIKNKNELRVIAFVQNITTKEVYNAEMATPLNVTSLPEINREEKTKIFPNPVKDLLFVTFIKSAKAEIQLLDLSGRLITQINTNGESNIALDVKKFEKGIYFLRITSSEFQQIKKISIE